MYLPLTHSHPRQGLLLQVGKKAGLSQHASKDTLHCLRSHGQEAQSQGSNTAQLQSSALFAPTRYRSFQKRCYYHFFLAEMKIKKHILVSLRHSGSVQTDRQTLGDTFSRTAVVSSAPCHFLHMATLETLQSRHLGRVDGRHDCKYILQEFT